MLHGFPITQIESEGNYASDKLPYDDLFVNSFNFYRLNSQVLSFLPPSLKKLHGGKTLKLKRIKI